ncbi:hypothetical protein V1264_003072 [Littorina saxatilis]|uniref:Uncharacterized protein n=1 Tax=Littorina saxatilis TaxID=31220 RepID=A0AAN9B547_9CAEN
MSVSTIFCVTLTLTLTVTQIEAAADIKSVVYTRKENSRVEVLQEVPLCLNGTCHGGRTTCVLKCITHAQCTGVNFRASDRQCMGVARSVYDFQSNIQADGNWENFSPDAREVRDGDWILVFRAQRGMDVSSDYDGKTLLAWNDDTLRSDDTLNTLDPDCFTSLKGGCPDFYRSRWLSTWPSGQIDKVRLALYTGGVLDVHMEFNGTGSSRHDWYHTDRLLNSSWTDLVPGDPANVLSLNGHLTNDRIFIATSTSDENDCNQMGWLLVINNIRQQLCPYDKKTALILPSYDSNVPQFLFSKVSHKINFYEGTCDCQQA